MQHCSMPNTCKHYVYRNINQLFHPPHLPPILPINVYTSFIAEALKDITGLFQGNDTVILSHRGVGSRNKTSEKDSQQTLTSYNQNCYIPKIILVCQDCKKRCKFLMLECKKNRGKVCYVVPILPFSDMKTFF